MPQRNGEWEEYHYIDLREYETFAADAAAAHEFAAECRRQEHGDRWMSWPGSPAPEPITRDRTRLTKKRAILLTDHPTDSSGVPVDGIPVGTPFVRIVGNGVDSDGNVQVRLPGTGDSRRIDRRQPAGPVARLSPYPKAPVAQRIAHRFPEPAVAGSSPARGARQA